MLYAEQISAALLSTQIWFFWDKSQARKTVWPFLCIWQKHSNCLNRELWSANVRPRWSFFWAAITIGRQSGRPKSKMGRKPKCTQVHQDYHHHNNYQHIREPQITLVVQHHIPHKLQPSQHHLPHNLHIMKKKKIRTRWWCLVALGRLATSVEETEF